MQGPEKKAVRVTILSRPYTLLSQGDSREVEELAESVNQLMLSIAARQPNADSARIAVLACLHLADRLRALERDLVGLKERVDRKTGEFNELLEQALSELPMKRLCPAALAAVAVALAAGYPDEIRAWREQQEQAIKAPGGWLTVAGLFWLKPGANAFGTDTSNPIVLPAGSAPARAGVFTLASGRITVTLDGRTRELRPDADKIAVGRLELVPIRRGDRYGIRMKDPESAFRRGFKGCKWFAPRESWRITARFVAAPRQLPVTNVLGQTEPQPCPGYAVFQVNGREVRLYPTEEGRELFFVFRDQTAGKETYGAGRFLDAALPRDGKVVLDFNKAYNPPCAFTPYATCPLPVKENRLPVRIEAGEMFTGH